MGTKSVRKRSKYSGKKYKRYKKGYWGRYKRQRKGRFRRAICGMKRQLESKPDPYKVKDPGTVGRPPVPPKTILICVLVKVLLGLSYIDTESFLNWVVGETHCLIDKVPGANTIQEHMKDIPVEYLEEMLQEAMAVLEGQEVTIIMDATGLSTREYGRWRTARYCSHKIKRRFVKMHITIEPEQNLILIGLSTKGWKHEHKFGLKMLQKLKKTFKKYHARLDKTIADSGYRSRDMASRIGKMKGAPIIKVRKNDSPRKKGSKEWKIMVEFQRGKTKEFMKIYCQRVIIEGIISAIKRLFGYTLFSRKRHNQDIEIMCRLVLWNMMNIHPDQF